MRFTRDWLFLFITLIKRNARLYHYYCCYTTQDSLLTVACTHGTEADLLDTLQSMAEEQVPPTEVTYNILLNHCAAKRNLKQVLLSTC
jgi:Pentatricopeptide repeat domain